MVAARYLGVPPWELAVKPIWWRDMALIAQSAEQQAEARHRGKVAESDARRQHAPRANRKARR